MICDEGSFKLFKVLLINVGIKEYVNAMTMSGSVEGVEDLGEGIEKVVVGRIRNGGSPQRRQAESLQGGRAVKCFRLLQGPNVKTGDLIPSACRSKLQEDNQGQTSERGILWHDVLHRELNLSRITCGCPGDGVYVSEEWSQAPISKLHLDQVVEFEITSNRPDCPFTAFIRKPQLLGVPLKA